MLYHLSAFLLGVILDWIIGDPMNFPHPIRWIGNLISGLTKVLLEPFLNGKRNKGKERRNGFIMLSLVILASGLVSWGLFYIAYIIHPIVGMLAEAIMTCYLLAAKSLYVESMKVKKALDKESLEDARYAVSMIVGRDTQNLDEEGVARAAVETVAENTSDGVIAPLIYTFIGGPVLGFIYKAINTMDSMVGYHNDKYENFGYYPAKLDDIVNYLPARISAVFMIAAAFVTGKNYSGKDALKIFKRDRYNHKSPNSAQTESVCAGALGLRLAGDAYYFGKLVKKPYIGDEKRKVESKDIKRAGVLMFVTQVLTIIVLYLFTAILFCLI